MLQWHLKIDCWLPSSRWKNKLGYFINSLSLSSVNDLLSLNGEVYALFHLYEVCTLYFKLHANLWLAKFETIKQKVTPMNDHKKNVFFFFFFGDKRLKNKKLELNKQVYLHGLYRSSSYIREACIELILKWSFVCSSCSRST